MCSFPPDLEFKCSSPDLKKTFLFSPDQECKCPFTIEVQMPFLQIWSANACKCCSHQILRRNIWSAYISFHQIWSANAWGKETKSGPGSLLKNTNNMRSLSYFHLCIVWVWVVLILIHILYLCIYNMRCKYILLLKNTNNMRSQSYCFIFVHSRGRKYLHEVRIHCGFYLTFFPQQVNVDWCFFCRRVLDRVVNKVKTTLKKESVT